METTEPTVNPNKFVEQRRGHRLNGLCDLMVEYGVTIEELEQHFLYVYEPRSAKAAKKRNKQSQAPIRQARAVNAVRTRWNKYEAMKTSHLDRKEESIARTAAVPKPKGLVEFYPLSEEVE